MKQQIKAVLDDDRGVSPVIGVILMVAITVILAAVIGTFVLGLGDSLEQTPQATLSAEVESGGGNVTISHNGGDSIAASDIRVIVGGTDYNSSSADFSVSGSADEFSVGDTITINSSTTTDTQVRLIHTPSESILLDTEVSP
jgi:flagellin-like protein